jgi:hypothetical protein
MGAGKYAWRWQWLVCARNPDAQTGDKPKSWVNGGYLWGSAELESGSEVTEYGAVRSTVSGTARFRQFPNLSTNDRLLLIRDNQTYLIDGLRTDWDANETIATIHSLVVQ